MNNELIISLLSFLFTFYYKYYIDITNEKKRISFLEDHSKINQIMRHCIALTKADRFLILKITNGVNKNIDNIKREYLVNAINEEHRNIKNSIIKKYTNVYVDKDYKNLLDKAEKESYYRFITDNENGLLKAFYEEEKIKESLLIILKKDNNCIYYCSVATKKKFTDSCINIIEKEVLKIKEFIYKYY